MEDERPPRTGTPDTRIRSEEAESTALIIGCIAAGLIAVVIVILIILKLKSRTDTSYKVDDRLRYEYSTIDSTQGHYNPAGGSSQQQPSSAAVENDPRFGASSGKNSELRPGRVKSSKDVKEWYV
jgi:hypothetical protein